MTDPEFQGKTLASLARIEERLAAQGAAFAKHQEHDDERFNAVNARVGRANERLARLEQADNTQQREALTELQGKLAELDKRKHSWVKGVVLALLTTGVGAVLGILVARLAGA